MSHPHRIVMLPAVFAVVGALLLTGCESTPPPAASPASSSAAQAPTAPPKCERREVTGSRMARCDDGRARDVNVISGESIRATGMPSAGAGGAPAN